MLVINRLRQQLNLTQIISYLVNLINCCSILNCILLIKVELRNFILRIYSTTRWK